MLCAEVFGRPRLLDLFCCAGGASAGYAAAGFAVYGADKDAQPRYPYAFHRGDAIDVLRRLIDGEQVAFCQPCGCVELLTMSDFAAVTASPPCHDHSALSAVAGKDGSEWLLAATREAFQRLAVPWVIENVAGAAMTNTLTLCGTQFCLRTYTEARGEVWLRRHRLFESNVHLVAPGPCHCSGRKIIGVYGHGDGGGRGWKGSFKDRQAVMGIDWMRREELSQAIPPAFTEFIGAQLLTHLRVLSGC